MRLYDFYRSEAWVRLRELLILERQDEYGQLHCECGQCDGDMLVKKYDIIAHHKIPLTESNVCDANIALNPDNIALVSMRHHNMLHHRFGASAVAKKVYLVWGAPCSGKTSFVRDSAGPDDLVVDLDSIWACISTGDRYRKPGRLRQNAFGVRDCLLDMVRTRMGDWLNAWVIMTAPLLMERERFVKLYGAETIWVDTDRDECLRRCRGGGDDGIARPAEWVGFINNYFDNLQPPTAPPTCYVSVK